MSIPYDGAIAIIKGGKKRKGKRGELCAMRGRGEKKKLELVRPGKGVKKCIDQGNRQSVEGNLQYPARGGGKLERSFNPG